MVRTVLVTGANSGIGLETSLHVARLGFDVVGTVRDDDKAESLAKAASDAGVEVEPIVLDVTDAARAEHVVTQVSPWALVNNAGFITAGQVTDVTSEEALGQLDALVVAPMRLATLALPEMRGRGQGRIVNVSSVAAHVTGAMAGWYEASKHALSAVTDALRREVAVDGIDVVLVEPGAFQTGLWDKAEDDLERRRPDATYPEAYDRTLRMLQLVRPLMGRPRTIAEVIGEALTAGSPRARYRVGADAAVIELLDFFVPGAVKDRLVRTVLGT